MGAIHAALLECSNITALDVRVTGLGYSERPDRWSFPFNRFGGDVYPRLGNVRLEGYEFGRGRQRDAVGLDKWSRSGWAWIRGGSSYFSLFSRDQWMKSNLELWLDAMDWSAVSELAYEVS
jgi:hypothetical protein